MDPLVQQIRNFKDFLQLYNKVTERCFNSCVDNFHNRKLGPDEASCVDHCVAKFSNVNQKILGVYIDVQTELNVRRMKEMNDKDEKAQLESQLNTAQENTSAVLPIQSEINVIA